MAPAGVVAWKYYLKTEDNFNWNRDKYTKALYDQINRKKEFGVKEVPANKKGILKHPLQNATIKGLGGGVALKDDDLILLQNDLPAATKNNTKFSLTKGGVFLHEVINHFHNLGNDENSKGLQENFQIPKSKEHDGAVQKNDEITPSEQIQLDKDREKTKDE